MSEHTTPKPGQCWSIRSRRGGPPLPPAVVLLNEDADRWQVAPLFAEADMADADDRRLTPEPDWLFGETWCALGCADKVHEARLFCPLGRLSPPLLRHLLDALAGRHCPLPHGEPVAAGLGDPRERFHHELAEAVRFCGGASPRRGAASVLSVIIQCVGRELRALAGELELPRRPAPALAYRQTTATVGRRATWRLTVEGLPEDLLLDCTRTLHGWRLAVRVTGLTSARIEGDAVDLALQPLGRQMITPPALTVPTGEYRLILNDRYSIEITLAAEGEDA